jgi:hypothetical protein
MIIALIRWKLRWLIPSEALNRERVETIEATPRTGDDIVRTYENRNRKRLAEMTNPLIRE